MLPGVPAHLNAPKPKPRNEIGEGLPAQLRGRRNALQLIQSKAAARVGVNPFTCGNWETEEARPMDRHYPGVVGYRHVLALNGKNGQREVHPEHAAIVYRPHLHLLC